MKISFVIPSFNSCTWLPHAVTSCLQQTYKDIEVVIVDDGSTDRTGEYLAFIEKNPLVKVVKLPKNMGRSEARNAGNRAASGDVICVLDADDLSTPNRAELVARKFKQRNVDYVYGSATVIDILGRPQSLVTADVFDIARAEQTLKNHIVHSTVAYTKEFAARFPYRSGSIEKLGIDDWTQQTEAIASGAKFDFIPQRLACYRITQSGISAKRDEKLVEEAKRGFLSGLKVTA